MKQAKNRKAFATGSAVTNLMTAVLAHDLTICEEWNLSIDLKLTNRSTSEWTKVFSVQVLETTDLTGESRIPDVWIRPDQSSFMLMIAYNINTNQSYVYNITKAVDAGNWINLKISQTNGIQEIKIDYELVYNKANTVSKTWTRMNLVTGNTNGNENLSTNLHYRNFEINTCKTKGTNIKQLTKNIISPLNSIFRYPGH